MIIKMNSFVIYCKRVIQISLFAIIPFNLFSQVDSINYQTLFDALDNCEKLTGNIEKLLPQYAKNEAPKAKQLLDIWEKTCDPTEPSQRMNILLDIAANDFIEFKYTYYYEELIKNFTDRIQDAKEKNFKEIYDSSKVYYNYIALRSDYDNFTQSFALSLRDKQLKNTSAYLLCVLFSGDLDAFNKLIIKDEYKNTAIFKSFFPDETDDISDLIHFGAGAGVWMPFGTLAHSFNINPTIGLNLRVKVNHWSYGIEFHFRIPNNKNPFMISAQDTTFSVKQSFSYNAGFMLSRLMKVNDKFTVEWIGGIGVDNIQTDKEKPDNFNTSESKLYYNITTLNLNTGLGFWYKLQGRSELGIQFRYMLSPYNWDANIDKSIGTNALLVSAYYGF